MTTEERQEMSASLTPTDWAALKKRAEEVFGRRIQEKIESMDLQIKNELARGRLDFWIKLDRPTDRDVLLAHYQSKCAWLNPVIKTKVEYAYEMYYVAFSYTGITTTTTTQRTEEVD